MRYVIFSGETFYAAGGWSDFHSAFSNLEDAKNSAEVLVKMAEIKDSANGFWIQLVDLQTLTVVFEK